MEVFRRDREWGVVRVGDIVRDSREDSYWHWRGGRILMLIRIGSKFCKWKRVDDVIFDCSCDLGVYNFINVYWKYEMRVLSCKVDVVAWVRRVSICEFSECICIFWQRQMLLIRREVSSLSTVSISGEVFCGGLASVCWVMCEDILFGERGVLLERRGDVPGVQEAVVVLSVGLMIQILSWGAYRIYW